MLIHDLLLLLWVYLCLAILQLLALPLIFYVSQKIPYLRDAAWGFGRIASTLILAFLVWTLAFLQLSVNTDWGVTGVLLVLLTLSVCLSWKFARQKNFLSDFKKKFLKIIMLEEVLFLMSLVFLFIMRSFQPEILGLEKFMDAGFVQAYLKSPRLPAGDIWFAGSSINYYSFGQFYNAILVHVWRMDLAYAYNFLLLTLFAFLTLELFSLAFNLRANFQVQKPLLIKGYDFKAAVSAGFLAVLLVALGANGHTLWYLFKYGNFDNYWYPDATRFIDRTIHEFPAYSFVVCDLHAHVLSLPLTLLMLLLVFVWLQALAHKQNSYKVLASLLGFLFGLMLMTNTWDVMIYGLLLLFIGLLLLLKDRNFLLALLWSAAAIFLLTALTAVFWYLNFTAISSGLLLTTEHTPFWQLVVLWGSHLFWASLLLITVVRQFSKASNKQLAWPTFMFALFVLILFLIVFPEIFYFKDIYSTYPRANTMFKLVFQAFMLLGLLLSMFFSSAFTLARRTQGFFSWRAIDLRQLFVHKKKKLFALKVHLRRLVLFYIPGIFFLFISTFMYPYLAYRNYYSGLQHYQGLDGLAWFTRKYPEDFVIMNYLKTQEPVQVNIVEAVGESYTEFARISAFSGMQTILGWRVHEWLWRAGWDKPASRTAEVEEIYLHPTSQQSKEYLTKYQIKYLVIGDKEQEVYPDMDLPALLSLGKLVVNINGHYLVQLF